MELDRETRTGIDISAGATVLAYTLAGTSPRDVIARVTMGGANPLSGAGGTYQLELRINDVVALPRATMTARPGDVAVLMVSSVIPLEVGDTVEVVAAGLAGDTAVDTLALLRDATPLLNSDLVGSGAVAVDHDYGGADALAYRTGLGAGVAEATVRAYLKSDWDGGRKSAAFVRGSTRTDAQGRWAAPMMLDPATYTILFYKQGVYGPDTADVAVA